MIGKYFKLFLFGRPLKSVIVQPTLSDRNNFILDFEEDFLKMLKVLFRSSSIFFLERLFRPTGMDSYRGKTVFVLVANLERMLRVFDVSGCYE